MELYQNIIQTNYKLAKITKMKGKRVAAVRKQRPNLNGLK